MQFVTNGPDIPNQLLEAHEEGRLVFFCGAGISCPAGLPLFQDLVTQIYKKLGIGCNPIERKAFRKYQFDATLNLLEQRFTGGRSAVRDALEKVIKPNLELKGATDTHVALLRLSRNRNDSSIRLVTTNFDRIFHEAAKLSGQTFQEYAAPLLPVPKDSSWNGLVYLHGLLAEKSDVTAPNRLVITSGDFGLAYLVERWAARFVSELFRNYAVCFVGYSINDPILRYMIDALAADRMQGQTPLDAWALGSCEPGKEDKTTVEWEAKGVKPILYTSHTKSDHSALHHTLCAWAETYRDGIQGKESIVTNHARTSPQSSTQQDDFVGRMLWAISDKSGMPAKRFADFNPAPSLDWLLGPFTVEGFRYGDLARFGLPPHAEVDTNLQFSLMQRPAPYHLAPQMLLVARDFTPSGWDGVMYHLARWLVRHLNDPRLIIWIAEQGGQLHFRWKMLIEYELDRLASLERASKISEINEIRLNAHNAIPDPPMLTLWRLVLSGRVVSRRHDDLSWYMLQKRYDREGLTPTLCLALRDLLTPKVILRAPFRSIENGFSNTKEPKQLRQLVDWEIVFCVTHLRSSLRKDAVRSWIYEQPKLLDDFQQLLCDALDLQRELGEANDFEDLSHIYLPSVAPPSEDEVYGEWVLLIELLRGSWLAIYEKNRKHATIIAQNWFRMPYPTFKRLAIFAASHDRCIPPNEWVKWLLFENSRWLWSVMTEREVLRLFVSQGRHLKKTQQRKIEFALLEGPPSMNVHADNGGNDWQRLTKRLIRDRLVQLKESGLILGDSAARRLEEIDPEFPDRSYSEDINRAPHECMELVEWITRYPSRQSPFVKDTWGSVCRGNMEDSLCALKSLAYLDEYPTDRWREALQVWSEEKLVMRSWECAAPLVEKMPPEKLQEIIHEVVCWLEVVSKAIDYNDESIIRISNKILELNFEPSENTERTISQSINHPTGHIVQALLNLWARQELNDNQRLPDNLKPIFTELCDTNIDKFRHGRLLLCSRIILFFRVDEDWTKKYLLPLFSWSRPDEAITAWNGFLWSPRFYQPLLVAFKAEFLATANHYKSLGDTRRQFAQFLTYVSLEHPEGYTSEEIRLAISALPQEGLEASARALYQALEGAGEQRENYWNNRVLNFWNTIWPKDKEYVTPAISESLTLLAIAAGKKFPAAFGAVQSWLGLIDHPEFVVNRLHESHLCSKYPDDALRMLSILIKDQKWVPQKLEDCLREIKEANPELAKVTNYAKLIEYLRRRE